MDRSVLDNSPQHIIDLSFILYLQSLVTVGEGYIDPYIGNEYKEHETYGYVSSILMGTTFNFTYIILINLVLQAIISGLIIDTFGEMREENEAIEEDIREKCFMCSIDRYAPLSWTYDHFVATIALVSNINALVPPPPQGPI